MTEQEKQEDGYKAFITYSANSSGIVIIITLSDRFNELNEERFVTPNYDSIKALGASVTRVHWHEVNRSTANATDSVAAIQISFRSGAELDEIVCKGIDNTLIPLMREIEKNMEGQLDAEIARLNGIKGRRPKRP